MNLYNFHSKPESLYQYEKITETNPDIFWEKYEKDPEELRKREKYLAKDARCAYYYARDVLKGPFPEGEEAIIRDVDYTLWYAQYVLEGPFPKGEAMFAEKAYFAYHYAADVLEGPFPKGEAAIAKDAYYANHYANEVLRADFYYNGKLITEV